MTRIHSAPDPSPQSSAAAPLRPGGASGLAAVVGLGLLGIGLLGGAPATGLQTVAQTPALTFNPPAYGDSDANRDLIAVTGPDQTGGSVLWVIDSKSKQIAVYQASGGSDSQAGLRFIGARRIDLDLQVLGYNDRSKQAYEDLEEAFLKLDPSLQDEASTKRAR